MNHVYDPLDRELINGAFWHRCAVCECWVPDTLPTNCDGPFRPARHVVETKPILDQMIKLEAYISRRLDETQRALTATSNGNCGTIRGHLDRLEQNLATEFRTRLNLELNGPVAAAMSLLLLMLLSAGAVGYLLHG